jgi:hypothetical protein
VVRLGYLFRHGTHQGVLLVFLLTGLFFIAGCVVSGEGTGESRAAIVIQYADGNTSTACVTFQEDEIDGQELLDRSAFSYVADYGNPMGSIICSIEGSGCDFPNEKCFCNCSEPGSCSYWAYFIRAENDDWVYAPLGARLRKIHHGDIDAWIWVDSLGFGQIEGTAGLPEVSFENICGE